MKFNISLYEVEDEVHVSIWNMCEETYVNPACINVFEKWPQTQ